MIHFFFLVNKLGQTRVARYFTELEPSERKTLESELVRKCLGRSPDMVSLFIQQMDGVIKDTGYGKCIMGYGGLGLI